VTAFEFVFGLLSIIASLGLTHLVASVVNLIRNGERVRFSPLHALWMWIAFSTTIGNWGSYWALRGQTSWSSALVLLSLAVALGQYAFCALVSPKVESDGLIDLVEFHTRERRRYAFAFLALVVAAFVSNGMFLATGSFYAGWVRDLVVVISEFALVLLSIFVAARPAQWIAVLGMSLLSTAAMIDACNILST
jgi:hypothetical protein